MSPILPAKLRDAREYMGFTREQVAEAFGWPVADLGALEDGAMTVTGEHLRKLSRLYGRPVEWFRGESRYEPGPELLAMVEGLGEHDRDAVLEFAEWLQHAGPAPRIDRKEMTPDA